MKKLFFLLSLLCASNLSAQTDMTDRIDDPDMESEERTLWKTNGFGRQGNNDFTLKHGGYYRETWSGGTVGDYYLYQDLAELPVGTYTLTITAQAIKQSNSSLVCTGAWFYANDVRAEFNEPKDDYSVSCVVTDGNLRIGVETKSCNANYVCVDNFRLTYQFVYNDLKDYITEILASVEALDRHDDSSQHTEMIAARDELQKQIEAGNNDKIGEALKRLQTAIIAYRYSQASPSNPMDMTEFIVNPSFENGDNGWKFSGMGTQGNSDFGKVGNTYSETWTDRGNKVSNGSITQTIKDLPNGRYKLTAVAQNIQQNSPSAKQTGCYIFGNGTTTEVNVYGTYAVEFINLSNEVFIGFKTEGATGNYCCVDDFHLYYLGIDEEAEQAAFDAMIQQAEEMLSLEMNTTDREALNAAIAEAKALTDKQEMSAVTQKLTAAVEAAKASNALYNQLNDLLDKVQQTLATGKPNGQDALNEAIIVINSLKASGNVDADKVADVQKDVEYAIFSYNVLNGSGTAPTVTTDPCVIVGGNGMVGRMKATGSNIIERGFCWAENPNPSVLDEHTSFNYSNDETNYSPVYIMYGVKASTEYWVRAYAITNTYAVGYGDPVRVITLPQGTTEYTYLWNGDDEHNLWLDNAMKEACEYYNIWTAIKGFHPTANYSPGTETADCSYGGWINVGPWRCNTGTMVHEMMHGTGVGQHGRWWSAELHNLDQGVWWLGERANRVTHFFENYDSSRGNYTCNGDGMHVCYEGNGNDMQQIRSSILMQALYEDGLPAVSDGACPFYSYESIDTLHYYITHHTNKSLTKYLCEENGKLQYKTIASTEALLADSAYAWNILYDKMTGLYKIRNLKTGKYFNHGGSSVTLTEKEPADASTIHLMPTRISKQINVGGLKLDLKPYWFAKANRVENPSVMVLSGTSATGVSGATLNFANTATAQFWLILTPEEISAIDEANQSLINDRLERLIAGSKAVAASNHTETKEGQDEAFLAVVNEIEAAKADYSAEESEAAVTTLFNNLSAYLPAIVVADSIDVSFVFDDPDLNTGSNWEGLPNLKNGQINTYNAPVFTATQVTPAKMPLGTYTMLVRGYHRPGAMATAMSDYVGGSNKVKVSITLNSSSKKIKHIAEGGAETKLGGGGTESKYSGLYVPTNATAILAYMDAGRYDNTITVKATSARTYTIGIKNTALTESDQLVVDGFTFYYYGNPNINTDIISTEAELANEIDGYYDLSGMKINRPGRGITIVKYKDGHSVKLYR